MAGCSGIKDCVIVANGWSTSERLNVINDIKICIFTRSTLSDSGFAALVASHVVGSCCGDLMAFFWPLAICACVYR
jgi:hypothetical protein